jgi:hypothetical protein
MLRRLVLLLILANLLFFSWSQAWLDGIAGLRAHPDREPERLARQVRPETIVVMPPGSQQTSAGAAASVCLEAGPFATGASVSAVATLQSALPASSWVELKSERGGEWIVYLGRFTDREALSKRIDELKRARVSFDEVHGRSELEPGLSLGRFDQRSAAQRSADQFSQRGVRGAKVIELSAPTTQHMLRVETADKALAARVQALKSETLGRGFAPCAGN